MIKLTTTQQGIVDFFRRQYDEWPDDIKSRIDELEKKELTVLTHEDEPPMLFKQMLDFRKGSTAADLKAVAAGERPCFLCPSGRLEGQLSLDLGDYELLVNPYPAAYPHLTIPTREHTPQSIKGRIMDMVHLSRLIPDCVITYNGPKCGASAPDHMHFQAVDETLAMNFVMERADCFRLCGTEKCGVYEPPVEESFYPFFFIDSIDDSHIEPTFEEVMEALPHEPGEEPMVNIVAMSNSNGRQTRIVIIPRSAHRPDFFGTGEGQMLVSPGVIEMMGTFTVSRPEDFERLDEDVVKEIYRQTALDDDHFVVVAENLEGWLPPRK